MAKKAAKWSWLDFTISSWECTVTPKVRRACKKLRPGMKIRHGDTHTVGEVMPNETHKSRLKLGVWPFVMVRVRIPAGRKRAGSYRYPLWNIAHLQIPAS